MVEDSAAGAEPELSLSFEVPAALRLKVGHAMTSLGPHDPLCKVQKGRVALACRGPEGPVSVELLRDPQADVVHAHLWGPGRDWLQERVPALIGLQDSPETFRPEPGPVAALWRKHAGMYLPRLPTVFPSLVQVVLLQLVRSRDAVQSWGKLVRRYGEDAPGPLGLRLAPSADTLKRLPYYELVSLGVLPKQARTVTRVAAEASRIQRSANKSLESFERRLSTLRGIGPWTIGYLRGMALGDPDAFIPGDYGLPSVATYMLEGVEKGDDADFERLLEPYRGHRYRVIRLLWASGKHPPRKGPRLARAHRPGHGRR